MVSSRQHTTTALSRRLELIELRAAAARLDVEAPLVAICVGLVELREFVRPSNSARGSAARS